MAAIDLAKQVGTTKGDLYVYNGTTLTRLAVGSDGQVLKAASGAASGVQWAAESGGGGGSSGWLDTYQDAVTPGTIPSASVTGTWYEISASAEVSFSAPASGIVRVQTAVGFQINGANTSLEMRLQTAGGTAVAGTVRRIMRNSAASPMQSNCIHSVLVTGLTPSTTYTWRPAFRRADGSGTVEIIWDAGGTFGPLEIVVDS